MKNITERHSTRPPRIKLAISFKNLLEQKCDQISAIVENCCFVEF